jgi:hypothetical protein
METEYGVTIEVDIDFDVGSPPDATIDPWMVADPGVMKPTESIWMTREGDNAGVITEATTMLYPPFTDILRRTVFFVGAFLVDATAAVTWDGVAIPVGPMWLVTDPAWAAAGVGILGLTEGTWFACEGELEADYRIVRPGEP